MLTAHQLEKYSERLHLLRASLDDRAPALRDEACHGSGGEEAGGISNAPIHLGDLGSQEAAAVVNVGLAVNEAALRQEVEDAFFRLDHGQFGYCEMCQAEIPDARLEAIPYARYCIRCAERHQAEGRF